MPYLIDGHNLIPKLGLRLEDPDDEKELIRLLQDFARIARHGVEVYFDGAPAGQAGARKVGMIKAHFVRQGQTADAVIRRRLEDMGKSAKNWTVVSSDHEVRRAATASQAVALASEEFVKVMRAALTSVASAKGDEGRNLSAKEVEEWMEIFGDRGKR